MSESEEFELPRPTAPMLVVFVPGLLSTSRFFEVTADPRSNLVTWFSDAGYATLTWDPPGIGRNRASAGDPGLLDFKSRVEALIAVIERSATLYSRLLLVGHSLGGAVIYGALSLLKRRSRQDLVERILAVITIASPALVSKERESPWNRLLDASTIATIGRLERDGWLSLPAFLLAQGCVSTAWRDRLLPLVDFALVPVIRAVLALAKGCWLMCGAILFLPALPSTFLRNRRDFTVSQFQRFLISGVLDRDSTRLVKEVVGWGCNQGKIEIDERGEKIDVRGTYAQIDVPTLAISSTEDLLVPARDANALEGPRITRASVGPCGHGGYLFRAWADTRTAIAQFLAPILASRVASARG